MFRIKSWKTIFRIAICSLCASLTFWRGWLCFERHLTNPQSIDLAIIESTPFYQPQVSFCVWNPYNKTFLAECGIQNYTSQWVSEQCPDPNLVKKKVLKPSSLFIQKAFGGFRSPFKSEELDVTALPRFRKHCFTLSITKAYDRILIVFTKDVSSVYINAHGEFSEVTINGIIIGKDQF